MYWNSCIARSPSAAENRTIALVDLEREERIALLGLARRALEAAVRGWPPPPDPEEPALHRQGGAFVTLWAGTELRGCIGHVQADRPLAQVVARMAVSAALEDPRFPPVAVGELADLRIEVSIVSELVALPGRNADAVRPGEDGVVVRRGWRQGLLLPQVATEFGWGAEQFLAAACRKAGLPPQAWQEPDTDLLVFQVHAFGE